ncbi:hypothetical protein [Cryptosporangium sp. NPDC051539]|uniref:hypothetical protein n=1 Tax=Cryptosporangium sp. NPDC051539 TaxID=3363962 RepID=UPI0037B0E4B7
MYAIVVRLDVLETEAVPSTEVIAETLRRASDGGGRVEHVRAERQSAQVIAVAFVTAEDAEGALCLGECAAYTLIRSTPSLRLSSVRMLDRPPDPI